MRKNRLFSRLTPAALIAIVLVLALAGGTVAWLQTQTNSITNTFTIGEVDVEIDEDFVNDVKSDVRLLNPNDADNLPIYVRAALVTTWVNDDDQPVGVPASLSDLSIVWGTSGNWMLGDDGYYYYKYVLDVGKYTTNLIDTATVIIENGYKLDLEVIADGIQAAPADAVQSVWPVTVDSDGYLILN